MRPRPNFPVFMDPAEKYPVGSPDWAGRISARVYFEYDRAEACGFRPLVEVLEKAVPGHPWKAWPPDNPWGCPDAWAQTLFGLPWEKVLDIVESVDAEAANRLRMTATVDLPEQVIGKGKAGPGRGAKTGSERTRLSRGENSEYLAARLKRDRPDIAEAVSRGEYPSIRAAAREAGIVKPPDAYKQLCKWWRVASPEQRAEFEGYITEWHRQGARVA